MNYKNKSAVSHLVTYQAQYLKHIASVEEYNTMMFICFALFQIRLFHIRVWAITHFSSFTRNLYFYRFWSHPLLFHSGFLSIPSTPLPIAFLKTPYGLSFSNQEGIRALIVGQVGVREERSTPSCASGNVTDLLDRSAPELSLSVDTKSAPRTGGNPRRS